MRPPGFLAACFFTGTVLLALPPVGSSAVAAGVAPPRPIVHRAGDLACTFQVLAGGVQLQSVLDSDRGQELLATNPAPLFQLTLREVGTRKEVRLAPDSGWHGFKAEESSGVLSLDWSEPADPALTGLSVNAKATADSTRHALLWSLRVVNSNTHWSVWRVVFPQLTIRDLGAGAGVLFPRGPGEVQRSVWGRSFKYHGNYPGGWCAMQFLAAYQEKERPTGLYVGMHDPWGSIKDLGLESDPASRTLRLYFDQPAPEMGRGGNEFELSGQVVWQLLRGDWFDAAQIYKAWVRQEARWWPALGAEGRPDTPLWMRRLNIWALGGGAPKECVAGVQQFRSYFGEGKDPAGFHWYNWHEIPFDNDYPHYFPAKNDFAQGVKELRESGVHVMPYINGRLWDTRDRAAEDLHFTRVALPAASKQEDGQPYVESYGSKETNGEPVRLAVMCPTTTLWQDKVRDTVLKLLREAGTSAVYIDQVAAAPPTLCMDATHGHPLGGGHWWNEGYWALLERLRRDMPKDAMLTTECNGEPFIRWFDGYLTWHWQHDGQVPVFPAVYGGAIQMFGRAYRGGATKDLALRMKAGQQLVFGEQIGWIDPGVIHEPENADFLKRIVAVRRRFAEFFHAGEMARPPKLEGEIPKVKADWQWSGEWWVTTDAVLTGAWRLGQTGRAVAFFVNTGDQAVRFKPRFDLGANPGRPSRWLRSDPGGGTALENQPVSAFDGEIALGPRQIQTVEW